MPRSIALTVGAATRTLTLDSSVGNLDIFTEKTGPLIGRLRLKSRLVLNGTGTIVRSDIIVEQSKVVEPAVSGGVPSVAWKQVWNNNVVVQTASSEAERTELYDLNKALTAHADIKAQVVNMVRLSS